MRKKLTLMFVALISIAAFALQLRRASEASVTYALQVGDTFTSGQTVNVQNGDEVVATITYGETGDGYADFKAAKADAHVDGFTAFTEGNGVNGNAAGGTFYTIVPKYDGSIDVAVVLNANKSFYILEDGQALENYNGMKVDAKYYGTYNFDVKADKSYKIYCAGSKLGFYGFKYNYSIPALWTEYNFTSFDFNKGTFDCSTNNSGVGDITETTGNLVITDAETGVKLTVTPNDPTKTSNRFWGTANGPQLRVYGGTMTFEAPEGMLIKELTFNNGKWNAGNTADSGTLADGKWTGSAAKVVVTVAGNTQLNSIVAKVVVKKDVNYFITGDFNNFAITGLPQMEWNEENKAYEYILAVNDLEKASFFITDVASVENFMGLEGHRFSVDANMNTEVQAGQTVDLANNNGTMKFTVKGKYLLSLSEDLKLTISKVYEDVEVNAAPGDIAEAIKTQTDGKFVGSITLNLKEGDYTITESIVAAGSIIVKGNGAKIDASALKAPFAQLAAAFKDKDVVNEVSFDKVTITGLPYQLFYANKQKVLLKKLLVENSIVGVDGTNKKTIFDFNSGGLPEDLTVNNSTIFANPTIKTNGAFYSTQSGSKIGDVDAKQNYITVTNSTLYNITSSNQLSTLRQNSQNEQKYIVKNSIIVDCGASNKGLFLKGLNGNQKGKAANFDVDNNSFGYHDAEGKYVEASATEASNIAGEVLNSCLGEPLFADAANGDFTLGYCLQKLLNIGDPRWNNTQLGAAHKLGSAKAELKLTVGDVVLEYPNNADVPANATVIVDVEKEGYAVKKFTTKPTQQLTVLPITENKKYAFAMPDKQLQLNATFMAILKAEWIAAIADQKYTGQEIKPAIVITDEYTGQVVPATEYTIEYANNVEAGEATVTVKGKDKNYTGEVTVKFNIIRQELKDEWIAAIDDQLWTGEAIEPEITVIDKIEKKVIDPENYTVEFANNVDAGEATVTVTAKENNYYIGQATAKFNIVKTAIAKTEDGSAFLYRVTDEASKEATIIYMECTDDATSFTIPATIDGYDVVAVEDGALDLDLAANVKDFYLPAVKGHAIAGITSELLTDTKGYHHPSTVARIHTPLEVLGEYAQALDYFTNLYKVSAVKEAAPRFWTLSCSVDVQISDGKVYIVKEKDATSVEKVATGSKLIAAGNGVLIEGAAGQNYTVTAVPEDELKNDEVDYSENLLVAVLAKQHFGEGYYILKNGEFHAAGGDADAMVPAGKAVLYLPVASAPILTISGEATGIKIANADDLKDAQIYDMNGRKVEGVPAQKGIYIVNGKKVSFK